MYVSTSKFIEVFKEATLENARNSVQEPGIARFDVIHQRDDATRFMLVEVYCTPTDPAEHKKTAHCHTWRDTVAEMMAEPRTASSRLRFFPLTKDGDRILYGRAGKRRKETAGNGRASEIGPPA